MKQGQSQIAVMGVTGYAGAELARLLLRHPRLAGASPLFLGREGSARESLTAIHPQLAGPHSGSALRRAIFVGAARRARRQGALPRDAA